MVDYWNRRWAANTIKRRPGRPRKNWIDTVRQDLKETVISWKEAQECFVDGEHWRRCVFQCIFDTCWTKNHGPRTKAIMFGRATAPLQFILDPPLIVTERRYRCLDWKLSYYDERKICAWNQVTWSRRNTTVSITQSLYDWLRVSMPVIVLRAVVKPRKEFGRFEPQFFPQPLYGLAQNEWKNSRNYWNN